MGSGLYAKANGFDDNLNFSGKCKTYQMARECGIPNIRLESYWNQGVVVYYAPTGEAHSWSWENRDKAWDWANGRKAHLGYAMAGGKYARRA